ncbi:uncharacterized protein yc1106_06109 [Curvularia clavata]|uniref:Zn(2)-C6 fungal-type domain-containing protein n=1 Tax=Curvularia clavata TaxID=95742 RepID=A0A9Q9DUB9_CURCL|nr:uncharacterized protein yc1106_06109 [Curvularia clavata]
MMSPPTHGSQRLKSKTGCLTCRARRKKCDEEHPTCIGCRRNHLICTWPSPATQHTIPAKKPGNVQQKAPQHLPVRSSRREDSGNGGTASGGSGSGSGSGSSNGNTAVQRFVTANKKQMRHLLPLPSTVSFHPVFSSSMPGLQKESEKRIFDHYVRVTATEITGRALPLSPFVSHLLPVAYHDTRVVTGLLAMSGAHLYAYKDKRFEHDARSYYAVTLRSVKHWLLGWKESSTQDLIGLLTVMICLCWIEEMHFLKGTSYANTRLADLQNITREPTGNVYHHLRASRTVLLEIRARQNEHTDGPLLDLLTEVYAFLAISSNITLTDDFAVSRSFPYDDFMSPESLLSLNRGTDIHGILMGSTHEMQGLIIPITESARHHMHKQDPVRKAEDKQYFERRIRAWKYVPLSSAADDFVERVAGEIQQQVILIYLHTMFNGTDRPSLSLMEKIDGILDKILELAVDLPPRSRAHSAMTWSARIAGSVCRLPRHRNMMSMQMQVAPENKPRAIITQLFLEDLWAEMDKDSIMYGPHGMEILMRRKNISLTCA